MSRPSSFNGGKMLHIFRFDDETKLYMPEFQSDEAELALREGKLYYKIDGSNGMIRIGQDGGLDAYQRLDTRNKAMPEHCKALPDGKNESTYTGHSYCYEPVTLDVAGKKAVKRNKAMLQVVADNSDRLKATMQQLGTDHVSIEWVGTKFNKTPNVPYDVAIAIHADQVVGDGDGNGNGSEVVRTFDGIRKYLLEGDKPVEGLVIAHNDLFWKIRSDCFDRKCSFKTHREATRAPIVLTVRDSDVNDNR